MGFMNDTIIDSDGEVVSIKDLTLTLAGSLTDEPPEIETLPMRDLVAAIMRARTFDQRNMPFYKKVVLLWRVFAELFLDKCYIEEDDPFLMVAARWYRRQQIIPISRKERWKIFLRR